MKVSVIMNCHNSSQFLAEALDSVYAQTYKDWEIILWDNASTDNSAEIAKRYDSKLRYFKNQDKVSLGCARNFAFEKAVGDYIAFLDCDDIWLPDFLSKEVAILENNLEAGLIYGNYYIMKDGVRKPVFKRPQPQGHIFEKQLVNFTVGILTVIIRRKAFSGLSSLFDEKLNLAEEFDLFLRLLYSHKAVYQDSPLAVYRVHPGMSSIRFMENWRNEIEHVLNKFSALYPDFENRYAKALEQKNKDLDYLCAKMYMKKRNFLRARGQIRKIKFLSLKYFLVFVSSYLPPGFWGFISQHFIRKPF